MLLHDAGVTPITLPPTGDGADLLRPGGDAAEVRRALRALGPLDREVLVLRFRDRLDLDEIATLTETTRGSVHQRLRRGALAVEEHAGSSAHVRLTGEEEGDERAALEDLRLGITPQLAARIGRAAASGQLPVLTVVARNRRRLVVEAWLRRRLPPLATLGVVGGTALLTVAAVAGTG